MARMGKRQIHTAFWWGSLTEEGHLIHVGVDGDIIKTDFKEIEREGVHSVIVFCNMYRWRGSVNTVNNSRVP